MANAAAEIEVEWPMSCCLGDHKIQNPRLLPCQHSFCSQCIKNGIGKEKKMFMICPKCQLSIPLKEKEVDQLPEDVLYRIMQETKGKTDCVLCKFENKKTPGTFQCLDCADILCDQCQKGHTKSSLTRLHRVVSLKEIKKDKYKNEVPVEKHLLCNTHTKPNKPMVLEFYCENCKCLACIMCVHYHHQPKGHTYKILEKVHGEKMTDVTDQVTKLLDLKHQKENFAHVLEQELGRNQEHKESLENEIYDRATKYIEIIEKVKEKILEKIKGHFDKEETSILTTLDDTKNRIIRIDSLVSYTQAFLKQSTKSQFLQHENEMMKTMADQDPSKLDLTVPASSIFIGEPQFDKTEAFLTEVFGEIEIRNKKIVSAEMFKPRMLMKETVVLFCENSGIGDIVDLTVAENGDIVAVRKSIIQVYDSVGKLKERIFCHQLQDAWNVVAKGDTLYLSSRGPYGNVLAIDFKGNIRKTITLPQTGLVYGIQGLAVDAEGNVYISCTLTHTIYKCESFKTKAKVFISDKHSDLDLPLYLCVTPGCDLIVSKNCSDAIQAYDRQGKFLWKYQGQGNMSLLGCRGVCCDSRGYIYVCDRNRNRIQIIKDGCFQGCVKMKKSTQPQSLDLDRDDNIVCYWESGRKITKLKIWK